jgi:Excalibur calcium-binding domain
MKISFKVALSVALGTLVILLLTALPASASASDKDCSDFASQRAAQIFFLKHGGPRRDPHRLDADHDGVACESNPCPCYRRRHLPRLAIDLNREFAFSSGMRE